MKTLLKFRILELTLWISQAKCLFMVLLCVPNTRNRRITGRETPGSAQHLFYNHQDSECFLIFKREQPFAGQTCGLKLVSRVDWFGKRYFNSIN